MYIFITYKRSTIRKSIPSTQIYLQLKYVVRVLVVSLSIVYPYPQSAKSQLYICQNTSEILCCLLIKARSWSDWKLKDKEVRVKPSYANTRKPQKWKECVPIMRSDCPSHLYELRPPQNKECDFNYILLTVTPMFWEH